MFVKQFFTNDEIMENTLEFSNHTKRGALSPTRVKKLKASMIKRFELDVVKSNFWWSEVTDAINQKGNSAANAAELAMLKEAVAAAQEKIYQHQLIENNNLLTICLLIVFLI